MADNPTYDDWMIGLTLAALARFSDLGLPAPDHYAPLDGVRNVKGNQMVATHGFPSQTLSWDTLSRVSAWRLLSFLNGATSAAVYVRLPGDSTPYTNWITYKAIMVKPDLSGPDGTPAPKSLGVYTSLALRLQGMVPQ